MKKIFLILSFALLFVTKVIGQAQVDIPLLVTDGSFTIPTAVGLDLTATDCIDPHLGEGTAPIPPPGVFDATFDLQPYGCGPVSTHVDYRPPGDPPAFPFTGTVEHTLMYQTSLPALPIVITYDLPYGTLMRITDRVGGSFLNLGPFSGQGTVTIPGSYTLIFAKAYLIMEYDNIIPIELTSFTATVLQNEKAVQLEWSTATETNNSGFEIQRTSPLPSPYQGEGVPTSRDGRGWKKIGFVPGFGTTTEPKSYSFINEDVTTGNYNYRLKQIDFDGTFTYSNEIEVEIDFTPKEFVLYQNYPNPFNPTTKIKYRIPLSPPLLKGESEAGGFVSLKVYDVLGNEVATLVNENKHAGSYEVEFSAANLANGVYFYKLRVSDFVETKKMILMK